jgi:vitamin B12 transporter
MFRLIIFLWYLLFINQAYSNENCRWQNDIPCTTISAPNSNIISNKISPTTIINRKQIEEYNLVDLPAVLKFVNGVQVVQSGPRGQQTSVFMRGTNSNHNLVLLNGIPINDQSLDNGAYDFGQDFMFTVSRVEVYKGTAGAHFGADAIGGAVNLVTEVDHTNRLSVTSRGDSRSVAGNYTTDIDGWQVNVTGGIHNSQSESALAGGTDKDGARNKSAGINIVRWLSDRWTFRSNLLVRNTLTDLDGHSVALQNGFDSNNSLYALQTGFDYVTPDSKSYITLHTHSYDREYNSPSNEFDNYESDSYVVRAEHTKKSSDAFTYGVGVEYKYDTASFANRGSYNSSLSGNYDNIGVFANLGYNFDNNWSSSLNVRTDNNNIIGSNNSYKLGIMRENLIPKLNVRLNHAEGFKNPSLYELYGADNWGYQGNINLQAEQSVSNEINFDYAFNSNNQLTVSLFRNEISNLIEYNNNTYTNNDTGSLKQSGIELAYGLNYDRNRVTFIGSSLSSEKTDGSAQLRRPELSFGINYDRALDNNFNVYTNYKYTGEQLDIHNSNWSTVTMPETHLLDVGVTKNYYGIDIGLSVNNLLDQDYQSPHGFSQEGRKLNFVLKRRF